MTVLMATDIEINIFLFPQIYFYIYVMSNSDGSNSGADDKKYADPYNWTLIIPYDYHHNPTV